MISLGYPVLIIGLPPTAIRSRAPDRQLSGRELGTLSRTTHLLSSASSSSPSLAPAQESGLSNRAFAVYWTLKGDKTLRDYAISAEKMASEADTLMARFPNVAVNADEKRKLS